MDIELTSKNARAGHCRTKSLHTVSPALLDPHEIVSGTIGGINRNAKYLHTWVETELGGIKCVIDTTMNAIVDANSYYKLVNANPQCRISNKDLQADAETITPLLSNGELYIEQYLYNHDDIMNYLQQTKN